MTTIQLIKTTMKTAKKYGFDREAFDAEMADYGLTTRNEYGCVAVVDETGTSVDWGHPVLIERNGEKYGNVMLTAMESMFYCGDETFSTVLDDVEWK